MLFSPSIVIQSRAPSAFDGSLPGVFADASGRGASSVMSPNENAPPHTYWSPTSPFTEAMRAAES